MQIIVIRAVGMYVCTYMFRPSSKSKIYKSVQNKCLTCILIIPIEMYKAVHMNERESNV